MTADEIQFNKEMGRLIRAMRLKQGMSQKYVANRTGVTFQQIQKYESGNSAVSVYLLRKISNIFETSFASYLNTDFVPSDYRILDSG